MPSTRTLARGALVAVATFPVVVLTLNLVQHTRYSPVRQAISELALGRGGFTMMVAFLCLGTGILALAVTIARTGTHMRAVPLLLGVASIPAGPMSAFFHTDPSGAPATLHGRIHDGAGLAAFLLILTAMVVASFSFQRDAFWCRHALPTALLAVVGMLAFFAIPVLGDQHFGLGQRLFVGTFVIWLLTTGAYADRHLISLRPGSGTEGARTPAGSTPAPQRP